MKLQNNQRNARVFFKYYFLIHYYMFRGLSSSSAPETYKAEVNKEISQRLVPYVGYYTISFQNARSLQHKTWRVFIFWYEKCGYKTVSICLLLSRNDRWERRPCK
jgi:aromatic ring-opening dioxygenase catalytic subunit (LigB family)